MQGLMELVAASFARHGIECPAEGSKLVRGRASSPVSVDRNSATAYAAEPTSLPEHNFRKNLQGDPAP
jgi:hypothetical protein